MEIFNLGDNLIRLRHEKKLTQDEIASFVGVTKAAVSKWENKQSMPDITILPSLATLFDISIDELIGYEPMVSKEQAKKMYKSYTEMFAEKPYEEVMEEIKQSVKKYFSSYRFLLDICILLINHYNLPSTEEDKRKHFTYIISIIQHIIKESRDTRILEDAEAVEAMTNLLMQDYQGIIDSLKDKVNPTRLASGNNKILIQAFIMSQNLKDADLYSQTEIFNSLLDIIGFSSYMISFRIQDVEFCNKTIDRIDKLIDLYDVNKLNPNLACQFYFQASINKISYGLVDEGAEYFKKFGDNIIQLIKNPDRNNYLDDYFGRVSEWYDQIELGAVLPRDIKLVADDVKQMIMHPAFAALNDNDIYKCVVRDINKL